MSAHDLDPGAINVLAAKLGDLKTYGLFINGEWVDSHSGNVIELQNPARRKTLAYIQRGDAVDVDHAVRAAAAAFPKWSRTAPGERQRILHGIAEVLRSHHLDYAVAESLNNGKPVNEAYHHDVAASIEYFEYYSGVPFQLHGDVVDFSDTSVITHREAIGPVAQIIPWNVSLLMAAMKLAPALAAGCTVVLKPAETVCLSVLEFINDIRDLVPRGVINVVTGYGAEVGEALVTHSEIRKVAFTGSRGTAQKIIGYAANNIIPQTMELGGKSANIVCADADITAAATSVVLSTVANKGEVCFAGTRVFLHEDIHDEFLSTLESIFSHVRQGDPLDPGTVLGAQASQAQYDKILGYIALGREEGATVLIGGEPAQIPGFKDGLFIKPTIFTDVRNDMRIAQEEIFGPVTDILTWRDEAEMLKQVNDCRYGLAGGIWTRDLTRAHRVSRAMQTGAVWINRYFNLTPGQAIGGVKESGYGREGTLESVLNHYMVSKVVTINLQG